MERQKCLCGEPQCSGFIGGEVFVMFLVLATSMEMKTTILRRSCVGMRPISVELQMVVCCWGSICLCVSYFVFYMM